VPPVLVLGPSDDRASQRSASWAKALAARFPSLLAYRSTKSREEIEELLDVHQHVLYFGHGEVDALVVPRKLFRSRQALIDGENLGTWRDRIVVAIACWSGGGLARTATGSDVSEPVAAYIGWCDEVSWPADWPDPIGEAVLNGIEALLAGGTVDECGAAFSQAFSRAYQRYLAEGPERLSPERARLGRMCATCWQSWLRIEGSRNTKL
jgi:hypothetical protein